MYYKKIKYIMNFTYFLLKLNESLKQYYYTKITFSQSLSAYVPKLNPFLNVAIVNTAWHRNCRPAKRPWWVSWIVEHPCSMCQRGRKPTTQLFLTIWIETWKCSLSPGSICLSHLPSTEGDDFSDHWIYVKVEAQSNGQ